MTALPLTTSPRVEKLILCANENQVPDAASIIAYNWAIHLQESTQNHGEILHFFSEAALHNPEARKALHDTVSKLLQRSLATSASYPPENALDPRLALILSSPAECASEILRFEISGYAALRHFYERRGSAPETAVRALTAVIRSAGEPIDGGVWDRDWESPVEPTALPAILRELLTCVESLGTQDALDVAKVVTDWEGCGDGLRKAAAEVAAAADEGSWVDVGRETGQVVKRVREALCRVLAKGWVGGGD